jgi:cyclopropane fatty-acyl-phospholipid synthase-like methyltransferase
VDPVNYGPASKYYDLFGAKNDIAFYKDLAVKYGHRALELGVGTGRVAVELAKAGVTVWGIDSSKHMLRVAREKMRKECGASGKLVILKLGDMRSFALKETFPFVYIASSTFEHCITRDDQRRCLTCAYDALERNGALAFDISQLRQDQPASSWWIDRRQLDAEEVVRVIFSRRDPRTNIVSVNLFFDVYKGGRLKERYYEYGEARISSREEIEVLLRAVGFRIERVYGGFDKSDCDSNNPRAVFIATKP